VSYDSILTVFDRATTMIHIIPTQKTCNAVDSDEILILNVFMYHGRARSIDSGHDPKIAEQW